MSSKHPKIRFEDLYKIVEKLRSYSDDSSIGKRGYNFHDPTALRALRIHRHLRALENEIIDQDSNRAVNLNFDRSSKQVVLTIQDSSIHCRRRAYLSLREFSFLRDNPEVVKILKKCAAWKEVA